MHSQLDCRHPNSTSSHKNIAVVVIVLYNRYLQAARPVCEAEQGCIGVSLYSPKINELVQPKTAITDTLLHAKASPMYTAQLPCSWGAAYRPAQWRTFRLWSQAQQREGKYGGDLELARGSGWAASWKRYVVPWAHFAVSIRLVVLCDENTYRCEHPWITVDRFFFCVITSQYFF